MQTKQAYYLTHMGIQVWQERPADFGQVPVELETESATLAAIDTSNKASQWQQLRQCVAKCQACPLHQTRTQTVFGVGDQQADLLIIGEAPGANEDRQGEPFVGRAGKLLDAMLHAIDISRKNKVYISNILKCRPPNNRDPKPEEVRTCTPFLQQQIDLLQPKLILAVGRIAAHFLLETTLALGRLRNRLHHYGPAKIPLIVSYHPAYLLRSPREKRKAYEDLLQVKRLLGV